LCSEQANNTSSAIYFKKKIKEKKGEDKPHENKIKRPLHGGLR
jgi:hypothetical protein